MHHFNVWEPKNLKGVQKFSLKQAWVKGRVWRRHFDPLKHNFEHHRSNENIFPPHILFNPARYTPYGFASLIRQVKANNF
jgi:hypothetical protein